MASKNEYFKDALAALERGESLRDIKPFRELAAKAVGARAKRCPEEVEDRAQELLTGLLKARGLRGETWRALLALDEKTLRAWLYRRLRWLILDRAGRALELRSLDDLPTGLEPLDEGAEQRIRRTIDGGRAAQRALAKLTARERLVLELRAKGTSVEETARIVGTGRSSVYEAQKSVGRKVGGRRTTSGGTRREALRQLAVAVTAKKKGGGR